MSLDLFDLYLTIDNTLKLSRLASSQWFVGMALTYIEPKVAHANGLLGV